MVVYQRLNYLLVSLVQLSSAAAERAFSLLENSFSYQQRLSLEDCFLSVMLQYNYCHIL